MIPSTILFKEIKNKALSGFIENEDILKKKFSDLDHHKKAIFFKVILILALESLI